MSADNYFYVRRHPDGGYVALMGFASDTDEAGREIVPDIEAGREYQIFTDVTDAVIWAADQYSEYGVSMAPDCKSQYASEDPDYDLPDAVSPAQAAFSNGQIHEADAAWASTGLHLIAEAISETRGLIDDTGRVAGLLTTNDGGPEYANAVFGMRPYCWCDADTAGHEEGCPPNFEHPESGLVISWYKHAGRGITANRPRPADWTAIVTDCLMSIHHREETHP